MTAAQNYSGVLRTHSEWKYVRGGKSYDRNRDDFIVSHYARQRPKSVKGRKYPDGTWEVNPWTVSARGMVCPYGSGRLAPITWDRGEYLKYNWAPIVSTELPGWFNPDPDGRGRAINKCLTKLRDNKVNLGVALAEAKQTAEFFATNTRRIHKLLSSAYSRNPKEWLRGVRESTRGRWKKVPAYYLENCYALNPLIADIHGAAEALADAYNRGLRPLIHAEAFDKGKVEAVTHVSESTIRTKLTWRGESSWHVGVTADVPGWVMHNLNSLGLTNPFDVLWEKTPYSFVVDQVIPIGNWIGTWDVSNYLTFRDGFVTRRVDAHAVGIYEPTQNTGLWDITTDIPGRAWSFWLERKRLNSFPTPVFPSLRNPLKLDNVAKAMALLTQLVGKHKKLANYDLLHER